MENFRPRVFDKLGFSEAELRAINRNAIFASASGFGSTGPMAQMPGQDLLMQARSGLIGVTGAPSGGPTPVGAAIVDHHGGALLALGILGALVRRLGEGVGTRVEASLLNAGLDLQGHAEVFREITVRGRTLHFVNHPNRYDGTVSELHVLALEIGEHTHEIMGELGYRPEDVARLLASRAVAASRPMEALTAETV